MEIPANLKSLLQEVDPAIEAAFLEGVTSGGAFLPKLPEYDKVPQNLRPQGRKGILSTFASLLANLSKFQPNKVYLSAGQPFANQNAFYYKTLLGNVVLRGRILVTDDTTGTVVLSTLPLGFRPAQTYSCAAASSLGLIVLNIDTNGNIYTDYNLTDGGWVSLDGIDFAVI